MLRSLTYYWRIHLAVLAAAAVASTVLVGALLVGDSVRGSLRDLTLERLGTIDAAILSDRFVREQLAEDVISAPAARERLGSAVPALLARGSVVHAQLGSRAAGVQIIGADERFATLFPGGALDFARTPQQIFPSAILNASLATEIGAAVGDPIVLSFQRATDVPRETLLGSRDPGESLGSLRATVARIVPDRGLGRFGLTPTQAAPRNVFIQLPRLQRALGMDARVNAILLASPAPAATSGDAAALEAAEGAARASLRQAITFADLGVIEVITPGYVSLESTSLVLSPPMAQAIEAAAVRVGGRTMALRTYLANRIRAGTRAVPYSTITAVPTPIEPPFELLRLADGSPAPALAADEILLDEWTATELESAPGDAIEIDTFAVDPSESLRTVTTRYRLRGIVRKVGLAADRTATPDYPGIQDAQDLSAWNPPFPVDLAAIRPRDEAYWDRYGAAPKAFLAPAAAALWESRFGTVTAIRIAPPAGVDPALTAARLRDSILERLDPEAAGFRLVPARAEGLRAADGATDFASLFLGFSAFLIVAAALLVGLLFRLGVEQRAREVGLLLAVGYPLPLVRRRLLAEGACVAAAGGLAGAAGAVGYAGALMAALRTLWLPAVGTTHLALHISPASLVLGTIAGFIVVILSIASVVRGLGRVPAPALLRGVIPARTAASRGRGAYALALLSGIAALGLTGFALATGRDASPALAFGAGAAALVAGLAAFAAWTRRSGRRFPLRPGAGALAGMAARNTTWSPGRSLLSVALVACAAFVIVTVGASQRGATADPQAHDSGTGGFALFATSDVPLYREPRGPQALQDLGFAQDEIAELSAIRTFPLRVVPGDDTSCLNLYRPGRPRLLGASPAFRARGGFSFQATQSPAENPWSLLTADLGLDVIPAIGDAASVQWILHLGIGRDLTLTDDAGRPVRLRIVGLLEDSLFQSELLIAEEKLLEHFPSRSGFGFFLIDAPPSAAPEAARLLETRLGPFGFDAQLASERLASFRAVENTYLSTFQVLGGLGLLLGTVGLGVVLLRNVLERGGELAALRAFGFRRALLGRLIVLENGVLLGLGIGLGTAAALLAVLPGLLSSGARAPWALLALTLLTILAFGMFASLAAVRGALRAPLIPLLKADR
jgi:ABC-type lipoprotein release transport system permease subunit